MTIFIKTYLTPSIPKNIFEIIARYIEQECNVPTKLIIETSSSGPKKGYEIDEDLSFMCTPPYYWLIEKFNENYELLPYSPVFNDIRNNNEPLYFSDILVRNDSNIESLDSLSGHKWAYNDTESLSGYFCIKNKKNNLNMICSGSHLNSIKMVSNGDADITCIDSNVLPFIEHNLKKIGTFGPHPVQPGVLKSSSPYKNKIIKAFEKINNSNILKNLQKYNILNFKYVDDYFYFKKYPIHELIK
jgi:phosphonate transport system substrate-binding protein